MSGESMNYIVAIVFILTSSLAYTKALNSNEENLPQINIEIPESSLRGKKGILTNPRKRGKKWERKAQFSLIGKDGKSILASGQQTKATRYVHERSSAKRRPSSNG